MKNKCLAIVLSFILIVGLGPVSMAQGIAQAKEEVVYVKLTDQGSPSSVHVVNIFRLQEEGELTDYGNYQKVTNLTSLEQMIHVNDQIRVKTLPGIFYYEGLAPDRELPWTVNISYTLDGQSIQAEDLAGKSGQLFMHLKIDENKKANPTFFAHYVLQVSLQFLQERFTILEAEGATQAVNGDKRVLTYTILPGHSADLRLKAEVVNFEMEAPTISGVPFNMAFDMPNVSAYTEDLVKLTDGVAELDRGAQALAEGLDKAVSGGGDLASGAEKLSAAGRSLESGTMQYADGIKKYADGLKDYQTGFNTFASQLPTLATGVQGLNSGLQAWNSGAQKAFAGLDQYLSGVKSYAEGVTQSVAGIAQVAGGMKELSDKLAPVPSAGQPLVEASNQLQAALDQILAGFPGGELEALATGSTQFKAGLEALAQNAALLPSGIQANIDGLIGLKSGLDQARAGLSQYVAQVRQAGTALKNPDLTDIDTTNEDVQKLLGQMAAIGSQLETDPGDFGLGSLSGGMQGVIDGLTQLKGGTQALADGLQAASLSYTSLDQGLQALKPLLQGLTQFSQGYTQFNQGLVQYTAGVNEAVAGIQTMSGYTTQAADGLGQLAQAGPSLVTGGEELAQGMDALASGAQEMAEGSKKLSDGMPALLGGTDQLQSGLATLVENLDPLHTGALGLSTGTGQLAAGLLEYRNGVLTFVQGLRTAASGAGDLAGGTARFVTETADMDEIIKEKVSDMLQEYDPGDFTPVSFVSEKNKGIQSVQFVMMGREIKMSKEAVDAPQAVAKKSLFEKIKDLFRKQK